MTQTDIEYKKVVERILSEGVKKEDRTGTGTMQVFGHMSRYECKNDRLPMLTTKRVHFKSVLHEFLWFLMGGTNIQYLCQNGVTIWDEWPYKEYLGHCKTMQEPETDILVDDPEQNCLRPYSIKEFAARIASDDKFAAQFGDIGKVYGKQWVRWEAVTGTQLVQSGERAKGEPQYALVPEVKIINQLQNAIDTLRNNPDSRRIIVTAWYPGQVEKACLPPCHHMYQFCSTLMDAKERTGMFLDYCRLNNIQPGSDLEEAMESYAYPKRKLSVLFNMRSVDTMLGLPFDIASYGLLLAAVAKYTYHVTSEVILSSADTHIYLNHVDLIKEQMQRTGFPDQPWVKINIKDKASIFDLKFEDFELVGYKHDAPIKAAVSV